MSGSGGDMGARVKALGSLIACVWLSGCSPADGVNATNTLEGVLPATESSKNFGDYVVYFNALNTDQLMPEVASEYGIVRSRSRAMLSVSIHRKNPGGPDTAVTGAVTASAVNLNGQLKTMTLREVREAEAIYYIGELPITDGEVLIYTIEARPGENQTPLTIRFQKQFFVEQ
jgi:hypothetical protein